jgi:hypothetical protein
MSVVVVSTGGLRRLRAIRQSSFSAFSVIACSSSLVTPSSHFTPSLIVLNRRCGLSVEHVGMLVRLSPVRRLRQRPVYDLNRNPNCLQMQIKWKLMRLINVPYWRWKDKDMDRRREAFKQWFQRMNDRIGSIDDLHEFQIGRIQKLK